MIFGLFGNLVLEIGCNSSELCILILKLFLNIVIRNLILVQKRDKIKNEYALSHNIPLVRIPYWERDKITLEMILGSTYEVREAGQPTG